METELEGSPIVDIQIAAGDEDIPSNQDFLQWVSAALPIEKQHSEVTLRIVGTQESQELNLRYRNQNKPTNILSFPCELPDHIDLPLLGDLVICSAIVEQEAREQNKQQNAHWAHMVVHGILHLLGYDHIEEHKAEEMEALESQIMASLGYPNPYTSS